MHEIIYYTKTRRNPALRKRRRIRFILILIIFFPVIYLLITKLPSPVTENVTGIINPLAQNVINKGLEVLHPDVNSKNLEEIVQKELKETKGTYAIFIKNLKTRERYYFNEQKAFDAASIYKLFVMGTVFSQIQEGKFNEKDILSQDVEVLNKKFNIASESAELSEGAITIPVQTALERMITISDNYSALLLTEKVRLASVTDFLRKNSFLNSKMGGADTAPLTTAYDIGIFFEKLYKGEIVDRNYSDKMLVLLKGQKKNDKLPKYLPKGLVFAHKTGELGGISHDGGIAYAKKADYIIVIFSLTSSQVLADEKIANISRVVYNYFIN